MLKGEAGLVCSVHACGQCLNVSHSSIKTEDFFARLHSQHLAMGVE